MGSIFGGRSAQPTPEETAARLMRLTAAVDQATAVVDEALRVHRGDRAITDLCLDVRSALGRGKP